MRVAIDVNALAGARTGVGTYLEHLLRELPTVPDPPELIGVQLSLRSRTLSWPGIPVRRVPVPAALLQRIWSVVAFPPIGLLTGRVDVVHGPNFVAPPAGPAATVITVHDLTYLRFPELVTSATLRYRELVPAAIDRGAWVTTPSLTIAAEVADTYRIDPERVVATPLGVDSDWGSGEDTVLPAEIADGNYLLFVGSIEPRKNLRWLLAAHRAATMADPSTPTLVWVGPPGWGDQPQPAAGDRPPLVLGYRSGAELRTLVRRARAVVSPSRYEGFGLTPLEALAAGSPVIASDIPVHREVLGECAMFVPLDDVDALAAALSAPPDRSTASVAAGRARAAGFTWSATAAATAAVYRSASQSTR